MSNALQKLENATRMLAEVRASRDPVKAKGLMDQASAAKHYAKKHKLGKEAIGYAHSIEIEAMAILGELRKQAPKRGPQHSKGGGSKGSKRAPLPNAPDTLTDLGLTKKESAASQLLATVAEEQPEEFEKIKAGTKSITQIHRERRRCAALKNIQELPADKFRVIYADPPWKYGDGLAIGELVESYGGAAKHYPGMTISELSLLPVQDLAHDDAVLFLWVTSPLLFECAPVFKAWGFSYKSVFVWDKVKHNMGHYNSVRHEFLLICTRGRCVPDVPQLFDSVQSVERTATHSQKPEEFRAIIDTLYPYGERLELFARGDVPTPWRAWGSEVLATV